MTQCAAEAAGSMPSLLHEDPLTTVLPTAARSSIFQSCGALASSDVLTLCEVAAGHRCGPPHCRDQSRALTPCHQVRSAKMDRELVGTHGILVLSASTDCNMYKIVLRTQAVL